jgi:hypothetical protein
VGEVPQHRLLDPHDRVAGLPVQELAGPLDGRQDVLSEVLAEEEVWRHITIGDLHELGLHLRGVEDLLVVAWPVDHRESEHDRAARQPSLLDVELVEVPGEIGAAAAGVGVPLSPEFRILVQGYRVVDSSAAERGDSWLDSTTAGTSGSTGVTASTSAAVKAWPSTTASGRKSRSADAGWPSCCRSAWMCSTAKRSLGSV